MADRVRNPPKFGVQRSSRFGSLTPNMAWRCHDDADCAVALRCCAERITGTHEQDTVAMRGSSQCDRECVFFT